MRRNLWPGCALQDRRRSHLFGKQHVFWLAAYFYARDFGGIWRVADQLECGILGINEGIVGTEVASSGGVKESGLGREGSRQGVEEFLEMKYMFLGGLSA